MTKQQTMEISRVKDAPTSSKSALMAILSTKLEGIKPQKKTRKIAIKGSLGKGHRASTDAESEVFEVK